MKETTFHNLTVAVVASSPREAYAKLGTALSTIQCEWTSDTFATEESPLKLYDTALLFGDGPSQEK
jgi:hypothetical protein